MKVQRPDIEIISAPSILGLRPNGVQDLGKSLLASGLEELIRPVAPVNHVPDLNKLYHDQRDADTHCLNTKALHDFSLMLGKVLTDSIGKKHFPLVLGGDCSILLGVMAALKAKGTYGLVFIDAHADFYEPERSVTGEVADMDLAIVTGHGPGLLTNINGLRPYVQHEHVVHIGQRDWEETQQFGSQDIRDTPVKLFDLEAIEKKGIAYTAAEALAYINTQPVEGYWIHFDTDVLSDDINPAVEYHLPGGLSFEQVEYLIRNLLLTGKMTGITVTIFNPRFDKTGNIARNITASIGRAFNF
jgi:arginase